MFLPSNKHSKSKATLTESKNHRDPKLNKKELRFCWADGQTQHHFLPRWLERFDWLVYSREHDSFDLRMSTYETMDKLFKNSTFSLEIQRSWRLKSPGRADPILSYWVGFGQSGDKSIPFAPPMSIFVPFQAVERH